MHLPFLGLLTFGCSVEHAEFPCKDGIALSDEGEEGYSVANAKLTIEGEGDSPRNYEASSAQSELRLTIFSAQHAFILANQQGEPVAMARWAPWAKSDHVDVAIYACAGEDILFDPANPSSLYPLQETVMRCRASADSRTYEALNRSATGHLFTISTGQIFIEASGPNVTLDLTGEVHPSTYTLSGEACVVTP